MAQYLDEIAALRLGTGLIGFTGGEPFMNPQLPAILELTLSRGFRALVLTNAMKPMHKMKPALLALRAAIRRPAADPRLARPLRPRRARGGTRPAQLAADHRRAVMAGAQRLCRVGRDAAGCRARARPRSGAALPGCSRELGLAIDADDPVALTVFPEMDADGRRARDHRERAGAFSASRRTM